MAASIEFVLLLAAEVLIAVSFSGKVRREALVNPGRGI